MRGGQGRLGLRCDAMAGCEPLAACGLPSAVVCCSQLPCALQPCCNTCRRPWQLASHHTSSVLFLLPFAGAPMVITEDLLTTFNISLVVRVGAI